MRGNRKTHRPSGFRGRGIQPLCDASPAQRRYVDQESSVSSSLAHNAQDRARAHEPERHHNDHDSEGNWHGLPDMMRKTLMVSENKEKDTAPERSTLIPFGDVIGSLMVHIKICRDFLPTIYLKYHTNLCICISINKFVKYTKSFSLLSGNDEKKLVIEVDETKFFSIRVPRRQDDKRNNISLGLVQCSDTENCLLCLGSIEVNIYEVVKKTHFTEELEILNENTCVCSLLVEFMFARGAFGYGFSEQAMNINKIPESLSNNQHEKRSEDIITLGVPRRSNEGEITPMEFLENDKKDLTIPTLKLWDQVNSIAVTPRIDESTPPPTDIAPSIIPILKTTEEGKLPHLHEQQSKAVPMDKMKNTRLPPIARRRDTHLSILEMDSSSAKVNTLTHVNVKTKKQATFDQRFQSLKKNNNNITQPVTFTQYQDIQTLHMSQNENCTKFPESQSFKNNEDERNSQPFFFPEVLKTENIKLKVHKERKYTGKSEKLSNNIGRLLPTARPTASTHLRTSVPKTLPHWTARTTIHDCSDKYEDDYVTPVKHPTKTKSRARLGGKNSDDSQNQGKHAARP